ncbi:hypothetical protein D3C85_1174280 [compost metagenome]
MRIAVCVSIIYLHLFSVDGLKVALTGCPTLSFSGHNLAKLGHDEKHVYLTRSVDLTNYAQVARSVGLDPIRMLRLAKLPASVLADPKIMIRSDSVGWLLESGSHCQTAIGQKRPAWHGC